MQNELNILMSEMDAEFHNANIESEKFSNGNNSAGTRLRKHMQNVKNLAQRVRTEVQDQKNAVVA
tara:strand:+ start:200 stop:394 length:195 start_codon:yes stop_codon:yes gene_type:complete